MDKKKILFTIQWYPSLKSANVLCDEEVINELKKNDNYEIHLLVPQAYSQKSFEVIDGVYIHRFKRNKFWTLVTWAKMNSNNMISSWILKLQRIVLRIRQFVYIPIYPIDELSFVHLFANKAIKLHEKIGFDMVVSEHSGVETLLAGYYLKKNYPNVKYLPILWDPILGKKYARYLPLKYAHRKLKDFESSILYVADFVVSMTSHQQILKKYFDDNFLFSKFRFLDLPKLSRPVLRTKDRVYTKSNSLNFVYAGIISLPDRDPYQLLESLDELGDKDINVSIFTARDVDKFNKRKKYKNIEVTYYNYIKRDKLLSVYESADFFINLGDSYSNMLPSKIFEYMSYGKPIISTYLTEDDCTINYLQRYPLCFLFNQNHPQPVEELKQFINNNKGVRMNYDKVRELFPHNSPKQYVDLIIELLNL